MKRTLAVDRSFDLDRCLYLAQDFRWRPRADGWHSGVLRGNIVHIRQSGDRLEYRADSDLSDLVTSYFRLDEDVTIVHDRLSSIDGRVARLVRKYPGLRVLRQQDPWECMVAYICSANTNVDRLKDKIEAIAENLGSKVALCGEVRHAFPTVDQTLAAGESRLEDLNLGLDKHRKIIAAAERIHSGKFGPAPLGPAGSDLWRGEDTADGLLRYRPQGRRLHRPVCAGQDAGLPCGYMGQEGSAGVFS